MALEWLDEIEQSVRHAEQVLTEFVSSLPPDDWVPERYGEYQGWPGLIDGVDETNSGDVHWHGVIVGRWQSAGIVREALGSVSKALRLCGAVRELVEALEMVCDAADTVAAPYMRGAIPRESVFRLLRKAADAARKTLERLGRGGEQ